MSTTTTGATPLRSHLAVVATDPGSAPRGATMEDDGAALFAQLFGAQGLGGRAGVTHAELVDLARHALRQVLAVDEAWFVESEVLAEDVAGWTWQDHGVGVGNPSLPAPAGGRASMGALGGAPVECGDRRVGVLVVWSRAARAWTSRDRKVLRRAALELGAAMTATAAQQRSASELLADEMGGLRSELLRLLDHELRTPLTVMLGGLEMLGGGAMGELTDRQRVMVERLERNAQRLLDMAESVTRVGDRRIDPDTWATEPAAAVELDDVLVLAVGDLGVGAPVVTTSGDRVLVDVPPDELRELLDRVLSNAAKFTPADGLVEVVVQARGSGLVEVVVSDTGCGIAADEVTRIGEPFYRSSAARDAETQGVGLGLAAAQKIARSWGGHLHLRSELGVGTTVSALLPGARADAQEPGSKR